jgi:hypothetical protein
MPDLQQPASQQVTEIFFELAVYWTRTFVPSCQWNPGDEKFVAIWARKVFAIYVDKSCFFRSDKDKCIQSSYFIDFAGMT